MARPLRYSEPWQPVEITARTTQGRFLLKPCKRLNALIAGILAIAKERYDVHIYNFVFLSNHFHLLAAAASPRVLSSFMGFVMGNIAREAGRLYGWEGPFWARRHRVIPIVDEASLIERMRYIFENGCKEGLVTHPALWPGLNAVEALTRGTPTEGLWVDRTSFYRARRQGRLDLTEEDF
ncbi:MAG: transposase, partial [Deltaproteobacteria bacterium]|nr:transposase [Deltaproteobacteria bacterium]